MALASLTIANFAYATPPTPTTGGILYTPGNYILMVDINYPGWWPLQIEGDGITLDLNKHTITGYFQALGNNNRVFNGNIIGVVIASGSNNLIEKLNVTTLGPTGNSIQTATPTGGNTFVIEIEGQSNVVRNCTITATAGQSNVVAFLVNNASDSMFVKNTFVGLFTETIVEYDTATTGDNTFHENGYAN